MSPFRLYVTPERGFELFNNASCSCGKTAANATDYYKTNGAVRHAMLQPHFPLEIDRFQYIRNGPRHSKLVYRGFRPEKLVTSGLALFLDGVKRHFWIQIILRIRGIIAAQSSWNCLRSAWVVLRELARQWTQFAILRWGMTDWCMHAGTFISPFPGNGSEISIFSDVQFKSMVFFRVER